MKTRTLTVVFLLLAWVMDAMAQESLSNWSVQAGFDMIPISVIGNRSTREKLAKFGQDSRIENPLGPTFSLSGVFHHSKRTEFRLSLQCSWSAYEITQYQQFGTDPDGNPRYDLNQGHPVGKKIYPSFSCGLEIFQVWNPGRPVELYSGLGFGLVFVGAQSFDDSVLFLPGITPVGIRFGRSHLYGFLEFPVGPIAVLVRGGLGWRF